MNKLNITSGEWKTKEANGHFVDTDEWSVDNNNYCASWVGVKSGNKVLALVVSKSDNGELEANAHLIAAAPELYDLLYDAGQLTDSETLKSEIELLLAKARGE